MLTRLVHKPEVLEAIGCSYPTLWKMMREGRFPRGRMVAGRVAWIEEEVDAWIEAQPKQVLKGD